MSRKTILIVALVVLAMAGLAACGRSATKAPAATPTAQGIFGPAVNNSQATPTTLNDLGTQTALAHAVETQLSGFATTTPLTPQPDTTAVRPIGGGDTVPPSGTPGPSPVATVRPVVATVSVGRPATYELKPGEYPYCIARRFNIDPQDLLDLNNLATGDTFYPGLKLTIPQTGTFPGERALHAHPGTYTVSSVEDTIYKIACYYGDLAPESIISANNLTPPYTLHSGQILTIP